MDLPGAYASVLVASDALAGLAQPDAAAAHALLRRHTEYMYAKQAGAPRVPWPQTAALAGRLGQGLDSPPGVSDPAWAESAGRVAAQGAQKAAGSAAAAGQRLQRRIAQAQALLARAAAASAGEAAERIARARAALRRAAGLAARVVVRAAKTAGRAAQAGAAAVETVLWYQSIGVGLVVVGIGAGLLWWASRGKKE